MGTEERGREGQTEPSSPPSSVRIDDGSPSSPDVSEQAAPLMPSPGRKWPIASIALFIVDLVLWILLLHGIDHLKYPSVLYTCAVLIVLTMGMIFALQGWAESALTTAADSGKM